MTNVNAALANDAALPIKKYIAEMQTIALNMDELMQVVLHLENEGACAGGRHMICETVAGMAGILSRGLDSVNIPEAKA